LLPVGFLKDYTRKYDLAFAIGGAMIIIAAFFHFCIACYEPQREDEMQTEAEEIRQKNKLDV
jgi:hypothetical protein